MNQKIKVLNICFLLLLVSNIGWSQDEDISISDVEVVKSFKAKLANAKKVPNEPVLPDLNLPEPSYNYDINIDPLEIDYPEPIIRPLAIKSDERQDPKMFWLKAGYGNLGHPEVDLGYNLFIEDLYNLSFYGSYEGGRNDIPRSYQNLDLGLEGSLKLSRLMEVIGNVNFLTDQRNLFNNDSINFNEEDLERSFKQIAFEGGIRNNELIKDRIGYRVTADVEINNLDQLENRRELVVAVPALVSWSDQDKNLFTIYNRFETSNSEVYDDAIANHLRANYKTERSKIGIDIGGSFLVAEDEIHLFPVGRLSYILNSGSIYVGADQSYTRNNIAGLYNKNLYVLDTLIENNLSITKDIFLGSEGNLEKLKYGANVGYRIYDDIVDFNYRSGNDQRFFEPRYYDGNAFYIEASAEYRLNSWITANVDIEKLFYNLEDADIGLLDVNLPDLRAGAGFRLHKEDKWQIEPKFNFLRRGFNNVDSGLEAPVELNHLLDLSIHADYFFHKNAGVYLSLNNILGQNYERWLNYPDFGFNVYGGIKLKF